MNTRRPLWLGPGLFPRLPCTPDDLQPVARLGDQPNGLLVPADSPFRSFGELVVPLRKSPGRYPYASNGNGPSLHRSAERLKYPTRSFVLQVPYRGGAAPARHRAGLPWQQGLRRPPGA